MRFLRILALSVGGLWLGSCGDEGGGGKANPDISWFVGCATSGCGSTAYHDQMKSKKRFKVSCEKIGQIIEFTITDPGEPDDPATLSINEERPSSQIEVSNGNTATKTCDVTVRDTPAPGFAALEFYGKCAGSTAMPTCTLTGQMNVDGWDWKGTLICDRFERRNSPTALYTLVAGAAGVPVNIAVDNCD